MTQSMRELIEAWDGMAVITHYDDPTESWIFLAIHNDSLGIPVGGTRMMVYPCHEDGLKDALRLAEGMTRKWAAIDVSFGGAKAVLSLGRSLEGEERDRLLRRYSRLLSSLHGSFATGEDIGTTQRDMSFLAEETEWVYGRNLTTGEVLDPGPFTALGVMVGMRAAFGHLDQSQDLKGRSVLVQGVGDVGAPLARLAAEAGARVVVSDVDEDRARKVSNAIEGEVVPPDAVYSTPCDVYAPCAVGATLNRNTIPHLQCRIVAGSANNQLDAAGDAERLLDQGILYAPDYVVNAGGAMLFGALALGETNGDRLREKVARLGPILTEIFREASERGESPRHAAERRVARSLNRSASYAGSAGSG